jgi:hypothetical protein
VFNHLRRFPVNIAPACVERSVCARWEEFADFSTSKWLQTLGKEPNVELIWPSAGLRCCQKASTRVDGRKLLLPQGHIRFGWVPLESPVSQFAVSGR